MVAFSLQIVGLNTNVEFLTALSSNRNLLEGNIDTDFIDKNKQQLLQRLQPAPEEIVQVSIWFIWVAIFE